MAGIRPGKPTADFIKSIVTRINFFGGLFLGLVAILPLLTQACGGGPSPSGGTQELTLSWSKKLAKPNFATGWLEDTATPANVMRVPAAVTSIVLPAMNSPSIAGERAVATFSVQAGGVPTYSGCTRIKLSYDSYANPFSVGQTVTFLFLPDGRFWSMEGVRF